MSRSYADFPAVKRVHKAPRKGLTSVLPIKSTTLCPLFSEWEQVLPLPYDRETDINAIFDFKNLSNHRFYIFRLLMILSMARLRESYPIILGVPNDLPYCESIGSRASIAEAIIAIRDTPRRSYVIGWPCIHKFGTPNDQDYYICGGEQPCANHYLTLLRLVDEKRIPVIYLKNLRRGEVAVAHLPKHLYWKFAKQNAVQRKQTFYYRIDEVSKDVDQQVEADTTSNRVQLRKKLIEELISEKINTKQGIDLKKEAMRYSAVTNIGKALEVLELVKSSTVAPVQVNYEDSLCWILYAVTGWDKNQYVILELEENEFKVGLIKSNTQFSSKIVHVDVKEIDKLIVHVDSKDICQLIEKKELISAGGALEELADILDDRRFDEITSKLPPAAAKA
jgi:hypothetical protein